MSYNRPQFQDLIERTLNPIGLGGYNATHLLMGTAAVESAFGTFLRQRSGPALGAFQIEPATFEWLRSRYEMRIPGMLQLRREEELETDLRLSIVIARLRYLVDPQPLGSNMYEWAATWKRVYNTTLGAGTVPVFLESYKRYVL